MKIKHLIKDKFNTFKILVKNYKLDEKKHQKKGIKWMLKRELKLNKYNPYCYGGILGDEMGLGKTIQVIGTMVCNFKPNTLIVVPVFLLEQWYSEIYKWTGHKSIIFHGVNKRNITPEILKQSPIIITTYGHIQKETDISKISDEKNEKYKKNLLFNMKFDRIVFDEAHHLRNSKSNKHKGAKELKSKIKWFISGTPIQNKIGDLYSLLDILGFSPSVYKDSKILSIILKSILLKRTKSEVGIKLPELRLHNLSVEWQNNNEKMLAQDIHRLCSFHLSKSTRPINTIVSNYCSKYESVLPILIKARQMCTLPKLISINENHEEYEENHEEYEEYEEYEKNHEENLIENQDKNSKSYNIDTAINGLSKINAVCSQIKKNNNKRSKIIFCHFRREIDIIKSKLDSDLNVEIIDGRITKNKRIEILNDKTIDILILQIMTGCEGLNLQYFKEIYFVSPHWNPAVQMQAISRCHRIGQTESIDVYMFNMNNFDNEMGINLDYYATKIQEKKIEIMNVLDK